VTAELVRGDKYYVDAIPCELRRVSGGTAVLRNLRWDEGSPRATLELPVPELARKLEEGEAVHHPECGNCGIPHPLPDSPGDGLCVGCWRHRAPLEDELRHVAGTEPGGSLAAEALDSGDPEARLFEVLGDHTEPHRRRVRAASHLSGNVPASEVVAAEAQCPDCGNAEQFVPRPDGSFWCGCGHRLVGPDRP
jgi:hypothetical protein